MMSFVSLLFFLPRCRLCHSRSWHGHLLIIAFPVHTLSLSSSPSFAFFGGWNVSSVVGKMSIRLLQWCFRRGLTQPQVRQIYSPWQRSNTLGTPLQCGLYLAKIESIPPPCQDGVKTGWGTQVPWLNTTLTYSTVLYPAYVFFHEQRQAGGEVVATWIQ